MKLGVLPLRQEKRSRVECFNELEDEGPQEAKKQIHNNGGEQYLPGDFIVSEDIGQYYENNIQEKQNAKARVKAIRKYCL
jgi:predicted metalloendopeptidase